MTPYEPTSYERGIAVVSRLILLVIYIGFLLWTAAPSWAFVLLMAIASDWTTVARRRR